MTATTSQARAREGGGVSLRPVTLGRWRRRSWPSPTATSPQTWAWAIFGIGGFGLTSLLIGLSTPVVVIAVLRVAQGVSGGFLTTNALSPLRVNVSEQRLHAAIGIFNSR